MLKVTLLDSLARICNSYRGDFPWEFAAAICRGDLAGEFAAAICHGFLP